MWGGVDRMGVWKKDWGKTKSLTTNWKRKVEYGFNCRKENPGTQNTKARILHTRSCKLQHCFTTYKYEYSSLKWHLSTLDHFVLHQSSYCNVPGFYSRWKFISFPKTQHTTVKYTQPFSKHTSGVYTQRCPTQDSFYMTSSGNLPTRTHILAVRKSPNTRASLAISQY
jgi:hypothetical protein